MYRYLGCGLDNVVLRNGFEIDQTESGAEVVRISNVEGLHHAIAKSLCELVRPLTASEFKFLRKELDMSQRQVAAMAGVTEQTVSLWERGNSEINDAAERLLRVIYMEVHSNNAEAKALLERFCALDREIRQMEAELEFEVSSLGDPSWRLAA